MHTAEQSVVMGGPTRFPEHLGVFQTFSPQQLWECCDISSKLDPIVSVLEDTEGTQSKGKAGQICFDRVSSFRIHMKDNLRQLVVQQPNGTQHVLPLPSPPLSSNLQDLLEDGLKSVLEAPDRSVNWVHLRSPILEEKSYIDVWENWEADGGKRQVEVFEVERRLLTSKKWVTPYLIVDKELRWRWVDSSGRRHPYLDRQLPCETASSESVPPCVPRGGQFQPESPWEVTKNSSTDERGWRYSMAWGSQVWDPTPSFTTALRKRRWTRVYV